MEKDGYSWWTRRIRRAMDLYDEFRIDHFRGFAGYWAVPAGMKNNSYRFMSKLSAAFVIKLPIMNSN